MNYIFWNNFDNKILFGQWMYSTSKLFIPSMDSLDFLNVYYLGMSPQIPTRIGFCHIYFFHVEGDMGILKKFS